MMEGHTVPDSEQRERELSGAGVIWSVRHNGTEDIQGVSAVDFTRLTKICLNLSERYWPL
jgi:hypothetical protein